MAEITTLECAHCHTRVRFALPRKRAEQAARVEEGWRGEGNQMYCCAQCEIADRQAMAAGGRPWS